MEAWGFEQKLYAKAVFGQAPPVDRSRADEEYGLGSTTAKEWSTCSRNCSTGKLLTADSSKEMLAHMHKCDDKDKFQFASLHPIGGRPKDRLGQRRQERPPPSGPVARCVLTADNADKVFKSDNAASVFIGRVAQEVADYFEAKAKKSK